MPERLSVITSTECNKEYTHLTPLAIVLLIVGVVEAVALAVLIVVKVVKCRCWPCKGRRSQPSENLTINFTSHISDTPNGGKHIELIPGSCAPPSPTGSSNSAPDSTDDLSGTPNGKGAPNSNSQLYSDGQLPMDCDKPGPLTCNPEY